MPKTKPYIFITYARQDQSIVHSIVDRLNKEGIQTWTDIDQLRPGDQWDLTIREALENAIGLLVFVSRASMKSEYVRREVDAVARGTSQLIIPIILEHVPDLPPEIAKRQWIDLTREANQSIESAVKKIAAVMQQVSRSPQKVSKISPENAKEVASELAKEVRQVGVERGAKEGPHHAVFIVHGSDQGLLAEVENYIVELGVEPIVLTRILGAEQSLFQKFLKWGESVRFAIVLFSADDYGVSRLQYEEAGVGDKALQFRARQNVILELGFFYGRLGWENVFVMTKPPHKVFPNFERPSDLDGVIFDPVDPEGRWKQLLASKLRDRGFELRKGN